MNDPARIEGAATAMCQWLGRHFDHFLALAQEADGEPRPGKFGPLTELSLVLLALTAPKYAVSVPKVHGWATDLARTLGREATRIGVDLRWDCYEAKLARDREAGLAWMFIPATEIAAGISTGFGSRLAEGLSDRLSIDRDPIVTATQDFLLFLELLGVRDCTDELDDHLRFIVERTLRQANLSCPDLYDATHGIFYLTRFGRLPGRCERPVVAFHDRLCAAALWQADEGDIDLAAEIVACLLFAGSPLDRRVGEITRRIAASPQSDGGIVNTRGQSPAVCKSFRCRYHPTLVALMALAEAQHAATAT